MTSSIPHRVYLFSIQLGYRISPFYQETVYNLVYIISLSLSAACLMLCIQFSVVSNYGSST